MSENAQRGNRYIVMVPVQVLAENREAAVAFVDRNVEPKISSDLRLNMQPEVKGYLNCDGELKSYPPCEEVGWLFTAREEITRANNPFFLDVKEHHFIVPQHVSLKVVPHRDRIFRTVLGPMNTVLRYWPGVGLFPDGTWYYDESQEKWVPIEELRKLLGI